MRIYLDVCCLNRPFDDQTQDRIRLEAQALESVFSSFDRGEHEWVISDMVREELALERNVERRERVSAILEYAHRCLTISQEATQLATELARGRILARDAFIWLLRWSAAAMSF